MDGTVVYLDHVNVNTPVMILYSFARCYQLRKVGKGYMVSLCIISYNVM